MSASAASPSLPVMRYTGKYVTRAPPLSSGVSTPPGGSPWSWTTTDAPARSSTVSRATTSSRVSPGALYDASSPTLRSSPRALAPRVRMVGPAPRAWTIASCMPHWAPSWSHVRIPVARVGHEVVGRLLAHLIGKPAETGGVFGLGAQEREQQDFQPQAFQQDGLLVAPAIGRN